MEKEMSINDVIKKELAKLGASKLEHPIFYNFPIGIRFEIGIGEVYDENSDPLPEFVEAAQYRVNHIYQKLFPNGPDIFAVEIFIETENKAHEIINSFLDVNYEFRKHLFPCDSNDEGCPWYIDYINLAQEFRKRVSDTAPHEVVSEQIDNDGESLWRVVLYWEVSKCHIDFSKLFKEIVLADIDGGMTALTSSTYLFNLEKDILFHLYDFRGLDVIAADRNNLFPLYMDFNEWILEYDRLKIDAVFSASQPIK